MRTAAGWALTAVAILLIISPQGHAHEVRPAYLEITGLEDATFDVTWKTPARGNMRLKLDVILPSSCSGQGTQRVTRSAAAVIAQWRMTCVDGLEGQSIRIAGLERSLTNAIVTFTAPGRGMQTFHLSGASPVLEIPVQGKEMGIAHTFWQVGVRHIALGTDHLLFVLTLVLLLERPRQIFFAVSAFTIAHSLTLAGAALLEWHLPSEPVEAAIALSIVFVAAEVVKRRDGRQGLIQRAPWIVAFGFGLLHGFGFAGAIAELGLPEGAALSALLFFNLGVETGQVLFVGLLFAFLTLMRESSPVPTWARQAPIFVIGVSASFWLIERTTTIFEPAFGI